MLHYSLYIMDGYMYNFVLTLDSDIKSPKQKAKTGR